MDLLIYSLPDGSVREVFVEPKPQLKPEEWDQHLTRVELRELLANHGPQPGEAAHECLARALDSIKDYPRTRIKKSDLPSDIFRNCWRETKKGVVEVDLSMAREQVMREVRTERDQRLAASDGVMMKLIETGSDKDKAAMTRYRQQLRDLPSVVQTEIQLLNIEALEVYAPEWPVIVPEQPILSITDFKNREM